METGGTSSHKSKRTKSSLPQIEDADGENPNEVKEALPRFGLALFPASLATAAVLRIYLIVILVGLGSFTLEPPAYHGYRCLRTFNLVSTLIIFISPTAFFFLLFKIPQKHISLGIYLLLVTCFCFSLTGLINAFFWTITSRVDRIKSMVEFSNGEFFSEKAIAKVVRTMEEKEKCCGIESFMDYYLEVFEEPRIPDHCCTNMTKGCGWRLFEYTPFSYHILRKGVSSNPTSCYLKSNLTVDHLTNVMTMKNGSEKSLALLQREFKEERLNESTICDHITVQNFLDPNCVEANDGSWVAYQKYIWCFVLFYKDESKGRTFAEKMNSLLNLAHRSGCFPQLEELTDKIVTHVFIFSLILTTLSLLMMIFYIKYYHDYRDEQLQVYPLPLWFQRIPGEKEDTFPRGLGRNQCHVDHFLALTTEAEAKKFVKMNPDIRKEVKDLKKSRRLSRSESV